MNKIEEKGKEIFEYFYTNLPPVHTNKQRMEISRKFSIKMTMEIIEGYEFDLIHLGTNPPDEPIGDVDGRIMDKINFWDEVQTYLITLHREME